MHNNENINSGLRCDQVRVIPISMGKNGNDSEIQVTAIFGIKPPFILDSGRAGFGDNDIYKKNMLCTIGGGVEKCDIVENDIQQTAINTAMREMREETGSVLPADRFQRYEILSINGNSNINESEMIWVFLVSVSSEELMRIMNNFTIMKRNAKEQKETKCLEFINLQTVQINQLSSKKIMRGENALNMNIYTPRSTREILKVLVEAYGLDRRPNVTYEPGMFSARENIDIRMVTRPLNHNSKLAWAAPPHFANNTRIYSRYGDKKRF